MTCQHGRQFSICGDCWNKRCDVCTKTLDALKVCEEHGERENPLPAVAEAKEVK